MKDTERFIISLLVYLSAGPGAAAFVFVVLGYASRWGTTDRPQLRRD